MLDDVQRRRFLEQPARKDPPPLTIGTTDVRLHKCARKFLVFPGRCRLARTQADNDIAYLYRLAWPHRDVAPQAVTLVEQTEHRHTVLHRRNRAL